MIYNDVNYQSALDVIRDSEFEFYLTGSRRFGTANRFSDYDFYTQDTQEVRDFLLQNDFLTIESSYFDSNCTLVMRRENVDVQLRRNIELYTRAVEYLEKCPYLLDGTPQERTNVWNKVMRGLSPLCSDNSD